MILVTERQARVFRALWELTDQGKMKWKGVVTVDGMSQQPNATDAVGALRRKGALDWAMTMPRTYRMLVGPESLNVQPVSVVQSRGKDGAPRSAPPARGPEADPFLEAAARLGLPLFQDERLKPSSTVYWKAPPRPDARAL